eukprot:TRINITY_DN33716_c0_g1_i1.p1 TRINITY_DN33716_c0_g1~~TRINITY_DN33716_c0_g1_i1.p1  ORF type:complete len:592 (-),score=89.64 TRINITY_DN33716_c0_g1_i1:137-1885(-)
MSRLCQRLSSEDSCCDGLKGAIKKCIGPTWNFALDMVWPQGPLHFLLYVNFFACMAYTAYRMNEFFAEGHCGNSHVLLPAPAACALELTLMLVFAYLTLSSLSIVMLFRSSAESKLRKLQQDLIRESVQIVKSLDLACQIIADLRNDVDALLDIVNSWLALSIARMMAWTRNQGSNQVEIDRVRDSLANMILDIQPMALQSSQFADEVTTVLLQPTDEVEDVRKLKDSLVEMMSKRWNNYQTDFGQQADTWREKVRSSASLGAWIGIDIQRVQEICDAAAYIPEALFKTKSSRGHLQKVWPKGDSKESFPQCVQRLSADASESGTMGECVYYLAAQKKSYMKYQPFGSCMCSREQRELQKNEASESSSSESGDSSEDSSDVESDSNTGSRFCACSCSKSERRTLNLGCWQITIHSNMHAQLLLACAVSFLYGVFKVVRGFLILPSNCPSHIERCLRFKVTDVCEILFFSVYCACTVLTLVQFKSLDIAFRVTNMIRNVRDSTRALQDFDELMWVVQDDEENLQRKVIPKLKQFSKRMQDIELMRSLRGRAREQEEDPQQKRDEILELFLNWQAFGDEHTERG